jgi:hypothetical protein
MTADFSCMLTLFYIGGKLSSAQQGGPLFISVSPLCVWCDGLHQNDGRAGAGR